jgi:transcriptional regulator with XRE-family HTH domain
MSAAMVIVAPREHRRANCAAVAVAIISDTSAASIATAPPGLQVNFPIRKSGTMDHREADVLAGVGPRLRALRRARGATLDVLAAETGLTASTLSRLENGKLRPTLEQLLPLARAHGVPLDDLVAAPPTGDPRIHLRPVRRVGLTVIPLTRRAGGIQAYKVIYPPAGQAATMKRQTHDGYEWFYVLDGSVRFVLGEQEFQLGIGEAAEFDTHVPHWIGSADSQPAELLTLFGAQGQRAHLSPAKNRNPRP